MPRIRLANTAFHWKEFPDREMCRDDEQVEKLPLLLSGDRLGVSGKWGSRGPYRGKL
jgi:hypothetical protein